MTNILDNYHQNDNSCHVVSSVLTVCISPKLIPYQTIHEVNLNSDMYSQIL